MISQNKELLQELDAEQPTRGFRTRDRLAQRRQQLPAEYKFERLPRGRRTNRVRRRRNQAPITGIQHRRNKKFQ